MTAQISPAILYASIMVTWIFIERSDNIMVVCVITAPITGYIYKVYTKSVLLFSILIIICYIAFIFFIKKVHISNDNARNIYRSLIIVSLTVIFGWFSTMLIDIIADILHVELERTYINLLAGVFLNFASATNFFVYYTVSKEYRQMFDEYLFIGLLKKKIGLNVNVFTVGQHSRRTHQSCRRSR
ncbi:hypothetical protein DICVIV_10012 [Dictyocaulus viviparus]|uniref:G-protein coupled receptors family 1 profile domain-containing protein n=1 Tax=Dictyocaulus viviparus TaxID=29172 RepID=A0A0D8XNL0_DICVI|nr:hypothetical protein DICVIV_10012 [Dictyocaulus viviparus]